MMLYVRGGKRHVPGAGVHRSSTLKSYGVPLRPGVPGVPARRSSSEFRIFWGDCPDQCGSWRRHHASRIGWTWWPLPGLVIVDLCGSLVYRYFFNFEQMPSEFCQLRNLFPASVPENRHSIWNALKLCSLWDATQNVSNHFRHIS